MNNSGSFIIIIIELLRIHFGVLSGSMIDVDLNSLRIKGSDILYILPLRKVHGNLSTYTVIDLERVTQTP